MADGGDDLSVSVGVTVAKLERQMAAVEARMIRAATKAEKAWARANGGLAQPERAARSAAASAEVLGRELDRLRIKYDPVFAASKRYEGQLEELTRAQKLGALSSQQYEAALERLNAEFRRETGAANTAAVAIEGLEAANLRTGRGARQMRGQVQNVAFQLGDFATQVGAGTSASIALGQQLPQLLGGFGALGAVLGAVVAIGVPLAAAFIGTGDAGKDMQERIDALRSAVDEYIAASERASLPTAELAEKYGTATAAAQDFLAALREITEVAALDQLTATLDGISRSLGNMRAVRDPLGNVREPDAVRRLREDLGVSAERAREVAAALQALGQAEGPQAQAEAARAFLDTLEAALGPYAEMNDEARALYAKVRDAGDEAARLAGAADGAAGAIGGAASAAGRLADELGRAVDNALSLAAQGIADVERARIEYDFRDDPTGRAAALAGARFDTQSSLPANADPTIRNVVEAERRQFVASAVAAEEYRQKLIGWRKAQVDAARADNTSSGGTSRTPQGQTGAGEPDLFAAADEQIQRLEREMQLLGKTAAEAAGLRAQWHLLDEARRRGIDLDQRQAASGETVREEIARQAQAVAGLTERYGRAEERARFFADAQQTVKDGMLDAILEGENLSGVLADVAKAFARASLEAALFGTGPFSGGKGGGLFGSVFSALTGALTGGLAPATSPRPMLRARAAGGTVAAGTPYRVGEHGPEPFVPAVNGRILSVRQAQAALTGGGRAAAGVQLTFAPVVDARGADAAAVARVERGLRDLSAGFEARTVQAVRQARTRKVLD